MDLREGLGTKLEGCTGGISKCFNNASRQVNILRRYCLLIGKPWVLAR
jgi:hypothetical protein